MTFSRARRPLSPRRLPAPPFVFALALASIAVAALPAGAGAPPRDTPSAEAPTIGVEEVHAGQRGYGLSVFTGTEPERFDVEVVGLMRNVSPGTTYILVRLTGHDLEKSGVAAGMSGSPVYIEGRLAGAVAFGWPFSHEAIAGVTPIASMRRLAALGGPAPAPPPPPVKLSDLLAGRVPQDLLESRLAALRPRAAEGSMPSIQWATMGFGERSRALLAQALGPVAPAGEAVAAGKGGAGLQPGQAVAAVLVDGDFRMAATGTVTDRVGDRILAFGHPFLGLGPVRVPMAAAEVVTVLSNQYSSFKITNFGETVGTIEQDRQSGVQGRIGERAPMVPMVVRVQGDKPYEFHMRVADVPQITPVLVASSALAGLDAAAYSAGAQAIDLTARFRLAGHGELEVHQSFDGDNAGAESVAHILAIASYLMQNQLERVGLEEIEVDLTQEGPPRAATLVGAHAERTLVRPGDRVALNLDLVAYRGDPFRRSLALDLPEDLPAGRYSLLVGDGMSVDAARLGLEPVEPVSFGQALDLLRSFHSRRELLVLGVFGGSGLSVAGEAMPHLPGSVRSLWSAAASDSAVPLRTVVAQEHREALEMPIEGLVRVDLEVRRREPSAGEETVPAEGDAPAAAEAAAAGTRGARGEGR